MVHGRRNFGPAPKGREGEAKREALDSAREAANERIRATRGGPPHEGGLGKDPQRASEAGHNGRFQRRAARQGGKAGDRDR
jgi:hypothetical protein